jgi:hypothetical protein
VDVVEDVLDVSTHIDPEIENKTRSVLNHMIQARKKKQKKKEKAKCRLVYKQIQSNKN